MSGLMNVEIRDSALGQVVGEAVELERIATGFDFVEGPIWHPYETHLTFSDMPGDHMRRWTTSGEITTFRKPSNKANGNAYDRRGRMVTCEHATSRVVRTEADGSITVLATHYRDKELNSPNDIVVKRDGGIYFTDPIYGRMPYYGVERPQEDGSQPKLLVDDFAQPSGLCFSRDESQLFINDTERGHIRVFDVKPDGTLGNGEIWAEVTGEGEGTPDGMKIDSVGHLYCCGPGGVHVFAPDRRCLGVILVPEPVANFTWGDDDLKSLFLTASTSLYRTRTRTPGLQPF